MSEVTAKYDKQGNYLSEGNVRLLVYHWHECIFCITNESMKT